MINCTHSEQTIFFWASVQIKVLFGLMGPPWNFGRSVLKEDGRNGAKNQQNLESTRRSCFELEAVRPRWTKVISRRWEIREAY